MNLNTALEVYITQKRSEGHSYGSCGRCLLAMGNRLGNVPLESITSSEIVRFLDGPKTSPHTWLVKYRLVLGFFDFWLARGQIDALPMPVKRKAVPQAFAPYIYTHSEIHKLLKAVRICQRDYRCSIDPITLHTLLIFIYGTGSLVGETVRLLIEDVDLKKSSVTIRSNRYKRSRTIPICPDLIEVLVEYQVSRQRQNTTNRHFFLTKGGEAITEKHLETIFRRLRRVSGIRRQDGASRQPRMYDLRHTFAVHRISAWIKHGANLNRMLPALSVYMGLAGLVTTEKYLSFTPERFRAQILKLSPHLNSQRNRKRWRDDPELMKFLMRL